jgi:hypothetical protein
MQLTSKDTSTTNTMTTESKRINDAVVKYADGSSYTGQLTRDGQRTGTGICRYPIMMYGEVTSNSATLFHWMEYIGEWENDEPTIGQLVRVRGDGRRIVAFTGSWKDGEPVENL